MLGPCLRASRVSFFSVRGWLVGTQSETGGRERVMGDRREVENERDRREVENEAR